MKLARQRVEDAARVDEAHLGFLRMNVHVDELVREIEVDDTERITPPFEHRAVRLRDGARERSVANGAAVDEEMEAGRAGARALGGAEVRFDVDGGARSDARLEPLAAEHLRRPLGARRHAEVLARDLAVARQDERDVGARERRHRDCLPDARRLGRRRLEEFAPRRDVEEQIGDLDGRSGRGPCCTNAGGRSPFDDELDPFRRLVPARHERQPATPTRRSGAPRRETRTRRGRAGPRRAKSCW